MVPAFSTPSFKIQPRETLPLSRGVVESRASDVWAFANGNQLRCVVALAPVVQVLALQWAWCADSWPLIRGE
eukprot:SAG22_NODE_1872_length_3397_cov_1.584900_2_plen_72_part_00